MLLMIELNEINFDYLRQYAQRGDLPAFRSFLDKWGITETTSETEYEHLEPWIQWVTAHTGMTFGEHGVFRLGDITGRDIPQIWEQLEARGYKVGAISPMNAKYRLKDPAFFVPDPWTSTDVVAPPAIQRFYKAVAQAVNDNADARITPQSAFEIAMTSLKSIRPSTVGQYAGLVSRALKRPWCRAMYLDLLLADVFVEAVDKTRPDFASLFLNAGAHIQHHYMFSSEIYDGPFENPEWYIAKGEDPIREVYALYDQILARLTARFPEARIMLATGLHQDPYPTNLFYWRLKDHAEFLKTAGIPFTSVEPRMSRDFFIRTSLPSEAEHATLLLNGAVADDGQRLFEADNRGTDIFVELVYPSDIPSDLGYIIGNRHFTGLRNQVAFVAIKNGGHNGIGYFADNRKHLGPEDRFPLATLPARIMAAMDEGQPGRVLPAVARVQTQSAS